MTELAYLESIFFKVLGDLKEYLDELTLVGGWLSYVYAKYVWNNFAIKPVTAADIDFGLGAGKMRIYPKTIFELLSSLNYRERHPHRFYRAANNREEHYRQNCRQPDRYQ